MKTNNTIQVAIDPATVGVYDRIEDLSGKTYTVEMDRSGKLPSYYLLGVNNREVTDGFNTITELLAGFFIVRIQERA